MVRADQRSLAGAFGLDGRQTMRTLVEKGPDAGLGTLHHDRHAGDLAGEELVALAHHRTEADEDPEPAEQPFALQRERLRLGVVRCVQRMASHVHIHNLHLLKITRAGLPTTVCPAATSLNTTAPMPTTASSPILTSRAIIAPELITARSPTFT